MLISFKHLVLSGLAGFCLAVAGWLCWWLGSLALGAPTGAELHSVWLALGVGIVGALAAGGGVSLVTAHAARRLRQKIANLQTELDARQEPHEIEPVPPRVEPALPPSPPLPQKNKLPRHPLLRAPLRARISATLRWQKMSKALEKLLGVQAGDLLEKPVFHTLHPEDIQVLDKTLQAAHSSRQVQRVLCRFIVPQTEAADARPRKRRGAGSDTKMLPPLRPDSFVQVRLEVLGRFDTQGKLKHCDCRFVDFTSELLLKERRIHALRKETSSVKKRLLATHQDLARLKMSYFNLYQNAPVMYFSIKPEGELVGFNDTLLRTLGYERRELQGRTFADLLAPAGSQHDMAVRSFPWQDGKFETQLRRKDGTLIEVLIRSMPEVDAQGELARYRSVALDLTELRARGDELERMNQRLRLINTELEDFTHVVSHDLKEPLRTLQAYSHILHEEYGALIGPDGFQYINHLIRASRRLGTLIDELLQLSQAGRITRAAGTFNLIEIVATVRQDLANLLEREKAALVTEGSLPDLVGDPVRITQLLTNLVANGLKYNQSEAPQVAIGAQPCADDPARVTIHVRDNGIGIDPAYHQQIFGIFRRLHKSDEYEGTGAGLAICKKIVEGHGGRIWVESQAGQGATFFFTLPCLPADRAAARNATVLGQERKSDTPSSATRRLSLPEVVNGAAPPPHIVLVEDQADIGMIIQKLGKRDGLVITWFPTAEEAWNQLQKMRPDLLLLDVNLPGMSGIELCQRIRTLAHLRDVPVAIFTPEQEPEQLQELRNAGADFFLTKDFLCQPTLWQQKLQELLNACGTHEPATSRADA